ncbi:MAG: hypothetical protein Q9195_005313 [Heterodermia aff. obscurata]
MVAKAQPTVFVNPIQVVQVIQELTESVEPRGTLNTLRDWVPKIAVPLAVGGSLALMASAAWAKNQSKNNTILSLQKELSAQAIRAEACKNQTALAQKTITSLIAITQRASELEQKRRNSHKLEVAKVRDAIKLEADEFQQQVDARIAEFKHLQSESAELVAAKNARITELESENDNLIAEKDILATELEVVQSEHAETKAALGRATKAENTPIVEPESLKAQVRQLTADKQSLLGKVADLTKKLAAASTEASATPKDSPETSGNSTAGGENRSANDEAPTSVPTGKSGPKTGGENRSANDEAPTVLPTAKQGAAASASSTTSDQPSANAKGSTVGEENRSANDEVPTTVPAKKQSGAAADASKPIDNSRASHLERLITSKAADFKGLVRFGPINYAEVAKSSKGLGAEHLALVMGRMMEMADESVEGRAGIAAKMGDKFTDYTPIVDQDTVEWACREIEREVEEGGSSMPVKEEPINKERRIALLQGIKAASLPRAIMVNWVQLAAMSKGLSTPLIEKVIDEAATTMRAWNVTEITQVNIAKAIEKVQGESGLSGPPSANVPSRGGFGYNQRGNYASGSSQSSPAPRGNSSPNSQRGGRGRGAGPPKPKIPEFLRKAQEEKLKKQQSPES